MRNYSSSGDALRRLFLTLFHIGSRHLWAFTSSLLKINRNTTTTGREDIKEKGGEKPLKIAWGCEENDEYFRLLRGNAEMRALHYVIYWVKWISRWRKSAILHLVTVEWSMTLLFTNISSNLWCTFLVNKKQISQRWILGPELCDMWTSSDVLCCTASILHLVAIATDR